MKFDKKKPVIAITTGDPNGIGWEIISKSLKHPQLKKIAEWKVIGKPYSKKVSSKKAGLISWEYLGQSVDLLKRKKVDGLVTAPVSKTHLSLAGFKFPGQTEFLAHSFVIKKPVMMLIGSTLKVTLVTIHIPLKEIFKKLTSEKILDTLEQTHLSLQNDFGIKKPKIGVCGLNPHAGENGLLGHEEKKIITPAILKARKKGILCSDPLAPDTIFYHASKGQFDAVVCHYHDQGLIPLKTLSFEEGVNFSIGLPIVRTSPDHGPAFDIAGKNKANPTSMIAAMKMAVEIWHNRHSRDPK